MDDEYWDDLDEIKGNVYDNLVAYLKSKGKTFDDVRFITVRLPIEDDEYEYGEAIEIDKADFINIAKDVEIHNTTDSIMIVGDNWFITSDTDTMFTMVEIPSRPSKKLNLAKELLATSDEDDINVAMFAGIAYDEDDE